MADGDYTNKGSLWGSKGFRGKVDIGGDTFYVLMVATQSQNESAPVYKAIIEQGREAFVVPVWKDDKPENKRVGYLDFADHFVSIFVNEPKTENHPLLGLSAMPKDPPAQQAPPPGPDVGDGQDDPCPF